LQHFSSFCVLHKICLFKNPKELDHTEKTEYLREKHVSGQLYNDMDTIDWTLLPFPQISVFQNWCVKCWFPTLHRNCHLKHTNEEKIEEGNALGKSEEKCLRFYWMTLRKRWNTGSRKTNTRSQSVETSLWKTLWICRKTDYRVNECFN
jgi:hypothetical protein